MGNPDPVGKLGTSPPTRSAAPSLERLDGLQLDVMLSTMLEARTPVGPKAHPLYQGLVRYTNKATREYELGRAAIEEWVDPDRPSTRLSPFLRASDHFETCIGATAKAVRYAQRLRTVGIPIDKALLPPTEREDRIRRIRDDSEHVYEHLVRGEEVGTHAVVAHDLGVSFGDTAVSYEELTWTITNLDTVVRNLMSAGAVEHGNVPERT